MDCTEKRLTNSSWDLLIAFHQSGRWGTVLGWEARLSFAILRATILCVRESRTKWRSLGIEDGNSLHSSVVWGIYFVYVFTDLFCFQHALHDYVPAWHIILPIAQFTFIISFKFSFFLISFALFVVACSPLFILDQSLMVICFPFLLELFVILHHLFASLLLSGGTVVPLK